MSKIEVNPGLFLKDKKMPDKADVLPEPDMKV